MIEEVGRQGYGELYKRHIARDFARGERRPLFLLRRSYDAGQYEILVKHDDETGEMLAYAGLLHAPGVDAVLLDYFAVEPKHRGTGVGSGFFRELAAQCKGGGILIECETPALAKDAAEQAIRERRLDFYLKNGAEDTGAKWHFFGVGYDLLWLPIQKQAGEVDALRDIKALYGSAMPRWFRRLAEKVNRTKGARP